MVRVLETLTDHGLPNAVPPPAASDDERTEALCAHAMAILDRFEANPLPDPPGPPPEDRSGVLQWVTALRTVVSSVLGRSLPVLPAPVGRNRRRCGPVRPAAAGSRRGNGGRLAAGDGAGPAQDPDLR
ncbi:hypothetical protein HEP87_57145 [Streptomyces sp. S1D4-11]